MKFTHWIKQNIQRDPQKDLSSKELVGLCIGLAYLAFWGLMAFRYFQIWINPTPLDKTLHKNCVVIASKFAKGSDSAYKATYDLCIKGEL